MKKIFVCLLVAMSLIGMACKSTPPADTSAPESAAPQGEATQAEVDASLEQIYDNYRNSLDMTGAQEYTVVRGDTLTAITHRSYGTLTGVGTAGPQNGFYFPVIMLASDPDSGIVDPDLIEPGMHLTIIDLQRNLNNPTARQAIKACLLDVAAVYDRKGVSQTQRGAVARESAKGLRDLANSL